MSTAHTHPAGGPTMSQISNPRSVGSNVCVGDTLIVGGPGATLPPDPITYVTGRREGAEIVVAEVRDVEGSFDTMVNMFIGGPFWSTDRFSLPVEAAQAAPETVALMVPDDVDVAAIPQRPYDFNKGDRRFADRQKAFEHAVEEQARTGAQQLVRRDPGSYDFQELILVQALGS